MPIGSSDRSSAGLSTVSAIPPPGDGLGRHRRRCRGRCHVTPKQPVRSAGLSGPRAVLLARAESEQRELTARAGDLAERERKLTELIDLLAGDHPGGLEGTPIQRFRGVLDRPAEGEVTAGFGFRFEPRYRTRVPHHGIELATAEGNPVQAVFPGKVVFAAPFQGYGNTVILLHPGRVFTLYAGLSELRVEREGMVSLADVVGLSTDKLYFEIRVEKRPEDPMSWLRVSP